MDKAHRHYWIEGARARMHDLPRATSYHAHDGSAPAWLLGWDAADRAIISPEGDRVLQAWAEGEAETPPDRPHDFDLNGVCRRCRGRGSLCGSSTHCPVAP